MQNGHGMYGAARACRRQLSRHLAQSLRRRGPQGTATADSWRGSVVPHRMEPPHTGTRPAASPVSRYWQGPASMPVRNARYLLAHSASNLSRSNPSSRRYLLGDLPSLLFSCPRPRQPRRCFWFFFSSYFPVSISVVGHLFILFSFCGPIDSE